MKIKNNNKIIIKSFSLLFIFCMALIGCNDDDVKKSGNISISFAEDSLSVIHDIGTAYLQLELSEPLSESCVIYLKSSAKEAIRFDFPEYIVLGEGAVRGKYPIYVYTSKFSFPDEEVTFTLDEVSDGFVIDETSSSIEFTIEGKNSAGQVFIGFEEATNSVGEDQAYFELPFKIQGVLEDSVKLIVTVENGTAIEGNDFNVEKVIQLNRGESWNFIPFEIKDDQESADDKTFIVRLKEVISSDTLVGIYEEKNECAVTIRNVIRQLQVTDSLIEIFEQEGSVEELIYKFNLTAKVPETVTAKVVIDTDSSTAIEGVHFELLQNEIEILSGEIETDIKIKIIDDYLGNKDRKIFLKLQDAVGDVIISEDFGTGKIIIKNDDNSVGFAKDHQIMTSLSTLKIPIIVEGLLDEKLTVQYKVIDGTANVGTDFSAQIQDIEKGKDVTYLVIASGDLDVKKDFQLELTSLQGENLDMHSTIDPNRNSCAVDIVGPIQEINRSGWTVALEASNAGEDFDCAKIIDNDETTLWHTKWSGTAEEGAYPPPPYFMVFDMKENIYARQLEFINNDRAGRMAKVITYVSLNENGPWELIHTLINDEDVGHITLKDDVDLFTVGRYVKLEVTGNIPAENVATMSEFKIFGNVISE